MWIRRKIQLFLITMNVFNVREETFIILFKVHDGKAHWGHGSYWTTWSKCQKQAIQVLIHFIVNIIVSVLFVICIMTFSLGGAEHSMQRLQPEVYVLFYQLIAYHIISVQNTIFHQEKNLNIIVADLLSGIFHILYTLWFSHESYKIVYVYFIWNSYYYINIDYDS